jgi:hypothetical protein
MLEEKLESLGNEQKAFNMAAGANPNWKARSV